MHLAAVVDQDLLSQLRFFTPVENYPDKCQQKTSLFSADYTLTTRTMPSSHLRLNAVYVS